MVMVYEGWDASEKGGNIRRLTEQMDPRGYEVIPTAAPNDVDRKAALSLAGIWKGFLFRIPQGSFWNRDQVPLTITAF